MRAVLLFPPIAGPTYVPLGLASLAAHLAVEAPALTLTLRDANVAWWHREALADPEGAQAVAFYQGRGGRFFDPAAYAGNQPVLSRLWARMKAQRALAEAWLTSGVLAPELAAHLRIEVQSVLAQDPEWIGVSVLYPEQLPFAVALARAIRQADDAAGRRNAPLGFVPGRRRILFGGAALSALNSVALLTACPWLDGIVLGEGERAVAALSTGAPPEGIPGLIYRTPGGPRRASPSPQRVLQTWPAPDFSGLDLGQYWNPEPVLPLVGGRGCPWGRCRFCSHNASFGRHRAKHGHALAKEIAALGQAHGARHVYLADQAVTPLGLDALSVALGDAGVEVALHAMMRPTPEITAAQLFRWSEAGCRWVSWGVESGSQRLLDLAGKGVQADRIGPLLAATHAAGIASLAMLIFGLPTSTDADVEATYALLETAWPHLAGLTASSFVLFANTPFGRQPGRFGLAPQGAEPALRVGNKVVSSLRLRFQELSATGSARPPRGPLEVADWKRRAAWLPALPLTDLMPAEHLLLWAAQQQHAARTPPLPAPVPVTPAPAPLAA